MIPPGDCMYAGRKRRKPIQKQRPTVGAEKSNPSKRHRDRLNAELDHLASLLPLPPDVTSKLDKLSVLRLSVSYLRVKSFFQVVQEKCLRQPAAGAPSPGDARALSGSTVLEGRLLLESLNGFALVVSAEGMIFYASATIVDYLGFHQTDVMHQNIYDYIHVDDRRDFCRQLHWAMDPPLAVCGQPTRSETGDDAILGRLLRAQEGGAGSPTEYSAFLTRCFVCRVRCLLDSTSGFLTMQFQGKLKFLFGQKKKAPSGTVLPPRLSLFCIVAPVLLPSMAETTMKSTFLRARHRADPTAPPGTRAKATTSLCESELHGKPNYLAGKSGGGNGISVYGAQTDAGRWPRGPARAPCLCFRGGPKLVLDPEGAAGDQEEEEQERPLSCSSGVRGWRETHMYNCRFETLGPTRYLSWTAEKCCQDGSVTRKLQPSKCNLFSMCATPRGSCTPYPGVQGTFNASSITVFRNSPLSHPPGQPPSVYSSRTSRPTRDGAQGQVHPPACHFPQGSLENQLPEPGPQCFTAGVYSTEDVKLRSLQTPLGAPCNPMLPLDVPIKMENDSGSEDTADGYSSSQVWLGASDVARKHLVAFPSRMHLKTEPDSRCQLYMPHLGHTVLGAPPHGRATAGPSRELAPFYPTQCTCLECMHGLPEPEPPHHLCTQGCGEHQPSTLGCDCRAPGATPMVKQEPLDSPPWATHSQRGVPGMFRKSALGTLIPPKAPECAFLL